MTPDRPSSFYPGAGILVSLALASVSVISMGFALLMDWDYFTTPGYQTIDGTYDSIAVSGMEIWNLNTLLLQFALAAWATTILLLLYRWIRHTPSLGKSTLLGLVITLAILLCGPSSMDGLQIRAYQGPGQLVRIELGYPVFPLFAYSADTSRDVWYGDDDDFDDEEVYLCTEEERWKFAGLLIEDNFYPTLDDEHARALMQQRCQRLEGAGI